MFHTINANGTLKTTIDAVTAASFINGGFAYTSAGALHVVIAGATLTDVFYNGGIATTAKGAMYVTPDTPAASAVMNGGILCRADGAVHIGVSSGYFAAGMPVSATGAVYIDPRDTADGYTPLLYTVVPTRGALTPSFTRATTETGQKYDSAGYLDFTALAGEVIFKGAMRIHNLITPSSEVITTANGWTATNCTSVSDIAGPTGIANASTVTATAGNALLYRATPNVTGDILFSVYLKRISGTGVIQISADGANTLSTVTLTTDWQRFSVTALSKVGAFGVVKIVTSGDVIGCTGWMPSNITGETDQTTLRPYVSVGVASAPAYHGSCVDSVKAFPYDLNGNAIPRTGSYPLVGYVPWEARTNHFKNSGTPATQTSASLGTGTYTLWLAGTGSIAVAGNTATITGAGTAIAGTPVTFVVTVAGTVTYTVTGSPTKAQSENGAFATPYIITAGAAVARNADILTYTGAEIANYKAMACTFSRGVGVSNVGAIVALSDGTTNNIAQFYMNSATAQRFEGTTAAALQWTVTASNAYAPGVNSKVSQSFATNNILMDKDGTAQTADTSASVPAITTLWIGHSAGAYQLNGPVTDNYFWTRNLSQSELAFADT